MIDFAESEVPDLEIQILENSEEMLTGELRLTKIVFFVFGLVVGIAAAALLHI